MKKVTILLGGVLTVLICGVAGFALSPGFGAVWAGLYYPLVILAALLVVPCLTMLCFAFRIRNAFCLVPAVLGGPLLFFSFLNEDFRSEQARIVTGSGLRGLLIADESGEFGRNYLLRIERLDGALIEQVNLGWFLDEKEARFTMREVEGRIVVTNGLGQAIAWSSEDRKRIIGGR